MNITSSDSSYTVQAGQLMRIERAAGWYLLCESGTLLVTQDGDRRDIELRAGAELRLGTRRRVLVGSAAPARFRLVPPRAAREILASMLRITAAHWQAPVRF